MVKIKVTTADRLNHIIKERGLKQVDILEMCKPYCDKYKVNLPKNALSEYVSGKVIPKQNKLTILALALNVNEVWLMGYNVSAEPKAFDEIEKDLSRNCKLQEQIQTTYGKDTLKLVNEFQKLDEHDKIKIIERVDVLLEDEKYSIKKESRHA